MNTPHAFSDDLNIRLNEPMHRHTSWRIGGPVDIYFKPRDRDDLVRFLTELDEKIPVL
ncbi:MAG: UDP-N-acetylenolpyruvoylglucosamine reductase, partial [Gammaproteobacteria bacterium]|nr:UDP-N-acetylenolpyruvoylglucosamine reductase [Gammaproteobacteria bacterium]